MIAASVFGGSLAFGQGRTSVGVYVGPNGQKGLYYTLNGIQAQILVGSQSSTTQLKSNEKSSIFSAGAYEYVVNTGKDLDNDGGTDIPDEYIGRDRNLFKENESLFMKIHAYGLNGHTATLLLIDRQSREVWRVTSQIDDHDWYRWVNLRGEFSSRVLKQYGEGAYRAVFIVANECVNMNSFHCVNRK